MFEIGYKAMAYYRDKDGFRILAKYRSTTHYPTEEEALEKAKSEFPKTLEANGTKAYLGSIVAKCYKYEIDTCPEGYCVCPRCNGSGVYNAPSNYRDNHGVKYCFKCEGLGIIKLKKCKL